MIDAITSFQGAVIMVTHNEYILHRIANKLIVFQHDRAFSFNGRYSQFLEQIGWDDQGTITFGKRTSKKNREQEKNVDKKTSRKVRAEFVNRRSKTLTPYKKKIKELEKTIEEKERELHDNNKALINASHEQNANAISKLSKSLKDLQTNIDSLYKQLEDVTEKYEREKLAFEKEESIL